MRRRRTRRRRRSRRRRRRRRRCCCSRRTRRTRLPSPAQAATATPPPVREPRHHPSRETRRRPRPHQRQPGVALAARPARPPVLRRRMPRPPAVRRRTPHSLGPRTGVGWRPWCHSSPTSKRWGTTSPSRAGSSGRLSGWSAPCWCASRWLSCVGAARSMAARRNGATGACRSWATWEASRTRLAPSKRTAQPPRSTASRETATRRSRCWPAWRRPRGRPQSQLCRSRRRRRRRRSSGITDMCPAWCRSRRRWPRWCPRRRRRSPPWRSRRRRCTRRWWPPRCRRSTRCIRRRISCCRSTTTCCMGKPMLGSRWFCRSPRRSSRSMWSSWVAARRCMCPPPLLKAACRMSMGRRRRTRS
mmetsp:Transcript_40408/g.116790  ORF Transcript_40408/g.116790 Transcript_40408/m.116790 type:complete len:359 (+) Transcript_40408:765-1841(+)